MIDLHTHTTESDGTLSPSELICAASHAGVTVLGITDHDTFAGYDQALPHAREQGIELVCGIELSTKLRGQSTHLLAYYLDGCPPESRIWIDEMQASRGERNVRLVERLCGGGIAITLDEVRAKGRRMTGRPHFAQILVEKGYVATIQEAFDQYLDRSAPYYVDRDEPQTVSCIEKVRDHGGITSLAHPCRLNGDLNEILPELCSRGLNAIEVYHADHTASQTEQYLQLAHRYDLGITGGSDFHGAVKPDIKLGRGRENNLNIPRDLLASLCDSAYRRRL